MNKNCDHEHVQRKVDYMHPGFPSYDWAVCLNCGESLGLYDEWIQKEDS